MTNSDAIAVLGAGSWGSAIAIHLAKNNDNVTLWGRGNMQELSQQKCNKVYLPEVTFPENLLVTSDLNQCLFAKHIIIAVPSHAFKSIINLLPDNLTNLSWLTKGLDPQSNDLLSELVINKWGKDFPFAIISGPSFAKEVAKSLPTAIVVSSTNNQYASKIRDLLHHDNLRVYLTQDIIGVQIAGAVKNVLAIACGISDGLGFGANARAALITRGLAEMTRLGLAKGATLETFMGLAGIGDLVLTCTDNQSRNRRFGLLLGKGLDKEAAKIQIGQVVEGEINSEQVCVLANKCKIEMPISNLVFNLLQNKINAQEAVTNLFKRPPKIEGF